MLLPAFVLLLPAIVLLAAEALCKPIPGFVAFAANPALADGIAHSAWASRPASAAFAVPLRSPIAARIPPPSFNAIAAQVVSDSSRIFPPIRKSTPEYPSNLLNDIFSKSADHKYENDGLFLKAEVEGKKPPATPAKPSKKREKSLKDKIKEVMGKLGEQVDRGLDDLAETLFPRPEPGLQPIPIPIPVERPPQFPGSGGHRERWRRRR